jgi:release factor glutamine methyltransferase
MTKGYHKKPESIKQPSLFPAKDKQGVRLAERKATAALSASVNNVEFVIYRGVYQTSIDTELMAQVVATRKNDKVLEIGCGCGAVSLLVAKQCRSVTGVDINPAAVSNSLENQRILGIENATFFLSDVFEAVSGKFDIIICNPPYNNQKAIDEVERMFWDPDDEMKRRFFEGARNFLKARGRIYFGWADFADLDGKLPMRLAESAGLRYVRHYMRPATSGLQRFYVIEFHAVHTKIRHK